MPITNILIWAGLLVNVCLFIYLAVQISTYQHKMRTLHTRTLSSEGIFSQVQRWRAEDPDNRAVMLYLNNKKTDTEGRSMALIKGKKHDIIRSIGIHMHEDKVIEELYHDAIRVYDAAKEEADEEESGD